MPSESSESEYVLGKIVDYGNGVYYFPFDGVRRKDTVGETLSAFITKHPELQLVTMSSLNSSALGTIGYLVVFEDK